MGKSILLEIQSLHCLICPKEILQPQSLHMPPKDDSAHGSSAAHSLLGLIAGLILLPLTLGRNT